MVWKRSELGRRSVDTRCVRTIVVWKQAVFDSHDLFFGELRENHSGMETTTDSPKLSPISSLRENHSGMETREETT